MYPLKKFFIIFGLAIILFVVLSAGLSLLERGEGYPRQIAINGAVLDLHIAVLEHQKELGLSVFSSLPADQGMLFAFDTPDRYGFWMKDMHFPIDIIWLDHELAIVDIEPSVDPATYPAVFTSDADASYVLETVAGFSEMNNLKAGDRARFID